MLQTVSNIFKVEDLRRRILFTLAMLVVFRIGSFIPVPNTNNEALKAIAENQAGGGGVFGLINTFSGGAFLNFSIFAMGIMPYITASIIVQLLTMDVIPKFAQWAKEGEVGRRKLAKVTRYGTIILGLIQSIGLTIGFDRAGSQFGMNFIDNPSFATYVLISLTLTAGTAFLMWLGEQITDKGIGNGISILIFAGIIAGIPPAVTQIYETQFANAGDQMFLNIVKILIILVVLIAIVAGVIFIQQGVRKIPVQYAKRVVGRKMYGGQSTHIPMKVNAAGVIPVIFALSLLIFPPTVASFWQGNVVADWIINNFGYDKPLGMVIYVILIIGFTYFYTFVQINPVQLADQMKKNGGYIPGIRPGKNTSIFLTKIMNRITLAGALFLAAVSILPVFFTTLAGLPQSVQIGGTSLLIVVGVALETMKNIESQLIKRHYKGFMK
ncbi:MAG: preprotein translocase subunit SecY [Firmicutes bacterium]|uniref:Protein translocase subunit SecY n=1 Tax=Melghirimyces thermohalophilus TaxID=1236220 RepID=A0A1G6PGQ9_9BACL|nr:preprotein translocase subunit SecY [Melghirimyces thermohalophilus]MDA8353487.1 preprotein translocase subunit SecY [Bacillota bacterium]SDC78627.1 protein translocase subunit secY/sec61 alpha [Melghirimyces thermohalophilus]